MKYFHISVAYDATKAGTVDMNSLLEDYKSIEELVEEEGVEGVFDYIEEYGWYMNNVRSVYVTETESMPKDSESELPEGIIYDEGIDYPKNDFKVPEKGVVFVQRNYGLVTKFRLEVDDEEEFDISSLHIVGSGDESIIYKDVEYSFVGLDGDDNGEIEIYIDGELLEC